MDTPLQKLQVFVGNYVHPTLFSTPPLGAQDIDLDNIPSTPLNLYSPAPLPGKIKKAALQVVHSLNLFDESDANSPFNRIDGFNLDQADVNPQKEPGVIDQRAVVEKVAEKSGESGENEKNETTEMDKNKLTPFHSNFHKSYNIPGYPQSMLLSGLKSSVYHFYQPPHHPPSYSILHYHSNPPNQNIDSNSNPTSDVDQGASAADGISSLVTVGDGDFPNPFSDPVLGYIMTHSQYYPELLMDIPYVDNLTLSVRDIVDFHLDFLSFHDKLTKKLFPQLYKKTSIFTSQISTNILSQQKERNDSKTQMKMLAILGFSHENRIFNILKYRFCELLLQNNQFDPSKQESNSTDNNIDCFLRDSNGHLITNVLSEGSTDDVLNFFQNEQNDDNSDEKSEKTKPNKRLSPDFFNQGLKNTISSLTNGDHLIVQAPIVVPFQSLHNHLSLLSNPQKFAKLESIFDNQKYSNFVQKGEIVDKLLGISCDYISSDILDYSRIGLGQLPSLKRLDRCENDHQNSQNHQNNQFNHSSSHTTTSTTSASSCNHTKVVPSPNITIRGVVDFLVRNNSFETKNSVNNSSKNQIKYTYDLWDTKLHSKPQDKDVIQVLLYAYAINNILLNEPNPVSLITHISIVCNDGSVSRLPLLTPLTHRNEMESGNQSFLNILVDSFNNLVNYLKNSYHPLMLPMSSIRKISTSLISTQKQFGNNAGAAIMHNLANFNALPSHLYFLNIHHKNRLFDIVDDGVKEFRQYIDQKRALFDLKNIVKNQNLFQKNISLLKLYSLYYFSYLILEKNHTVLDDYVFVPTIDGFPSILSSNRAKDASNSILTIDGYCSMTYRTWFNILMNITRQIEKFQHGQKNEQNNQPKCSKFQICQQNSIFREFVNPNIENLIHFNQLNWLPPTPLSFTITNLLRYHEDGSYNTHDTLPDCILGNNRIPEILLYFFSNWSSLLSDYFISHPSHITTPPRQIDGYLSYERWDVGDLHRMDNLDDVRRLLSLRVSEQSFTFIRPPAIPSLNHDVAKQLLDTNAITLDWLQQAIAYYIAINYDESKKLENKNGGKNEAKNERKTKPDLNVDIFLDLEGAPMINDVTSLQPYTLLDGDILQLFGSDFDNFDDIKVIKSKPQNGKNGKNEFCSPALFSESVEINLTIEKQQFIAPHHSLLDSPIKTCRNTNVEDSYDINVSSQESWESLDFGLEDAFTKLSLENVLDKKDKQKQKQKQNKKNFIFELFNGYRKYFTKSKVVLDAKNDIITHNGSNGDGDYAQSILTAANNLYYLFGFTYSCTLDQFIDFNTNFYNQQNNNKKNQTEIKIIFNKEQNELIISAICQKSGKIVTKQAIKLVKDLQDDYNNISKLSTLYTTFQQAIPLDISQNDIILTQSNWDLLSQRSDPNSPTNSLTNPPNNSPFITVFVDLWAQDPDEEIQCVEIFFDFCDALYKTQQTSMSGNDTSVSYGTTPFNIYHYHTYERTALHAVFAQFAKKTDKMSQKSIHKSVSDHYRDDSDVGSDGDDGNPRGYDLMRLKLTKQLQQYCPHPDPVSLLPGQPPSKAKSPTQSKTSGIVLNNTHGHCVDVLDLVKKLIRTNKGSLSLKKVEQLPLVTMKNKLEWLELGKLTQVQGGGDGKDNNGVNTKNETGTTTVGRTTKIKEGGSSVVQYMIWKHQNDLDRYKYNQNKNKNNDEKLDSQNGSIETSTEAQRQQPWGRGSLSTYCSAPWSLYHTNGPNEQNDNLLWHLRQYNRDDCYHTQIFVYWLFDIHEQLMKINE